MTQVDAIPSFVEEPNLALLLTSTTPPPLKN